MVVDPNVSDDEATASVSPTAKSTQPNASPALSPSSPVSEAAALKVVSSASRHLIISATDYRAPSLCNLYAIACCSRRGVALAKTPTLIAKADNCERHSCGKTSQNRSTAKTFAIRRSRQRQQCGDGERKCRNDGRRHYGADISCNKCAAAAAATAAASAQPKFRTHRFHCKHATRSPTRES